MKKGLRNIVITVITLLIIMSVFFWTFGKVSSRKLNLGEMHVGKDIVKFHNSTIFNGYSGFFWSEKDFVILSEEEYDNRFPNSNGLDVEIKLPDGAHNEEHFYQYTPAMKNRKGILHDEVYKFELPCSGTSNEGVIYTRRTTGYEMLLNDRSYAEVVLTKEIHPLTLDTIESYGNIQFSSNINGKNVAVGESKTGDEDSTIANYQVVIKDIDDEGINCYVLAEGMTREYLVHLLQVLCGENVKAPELNKVDRNEAALTEAKEKIEVEKTALESIKISMKKELKGKITKLVFDNYPLYEGKVKTYKGKAYNVTTNYMVDTKGKKGEEQTFNAKRWMLIEKVEDGEYHEIGKSLIEYEKAEIE